MQLTPIIPISAVLLTAIPVFAADAPKVTYQDHVLPLFRNSCLNCHNPDKKKAGLDLSTYGAALAGSDAQKVITPGDADSSILYKVVAHLEEPKMPQKADKLPAKDLEAIKNWINGGALENSGSKAVAKPKVNLTVNVSALGKPDGPPPMPSESITKSLVVKTKIPGPLNALASSPWAPLVALGGQKQVLLYNPDTLAFLGVLPFPEGTPDVLHFSRNGSLLIAGGGQGAKLGKVIVWEVASGKRIAEVGDEFDAILAADISPDQSRIAIGGTSRLLKILTVNNEPLHSIKKHTDWVTAVAFSPDGVLLASGDRAGNLAVWEAKTGAEYQVLAGHKGAVTGLCFRGDSNVLASSSEDGTIKLWNMENGSQIKTWNAHGGGALSIHFTHDGRLVSSGRDKLAKTWKPDGAADKSFEAFPDIALHSAFSHDGNRVIAGDWTGQISVYNTADGKKLGSLSLNAPPETPTIDPALIAAAEKKLVEAQKAHDTAAAALAAAQQAADTTHAELASAQSAHDAAKKAADEAKAALDAANGQVAAATAAIKAAQATLPAQQAEVQKLSAALVPLLTQSNQALSEQKPLFESVAIKQRIADALSHAAALAKAESDKNPSDKPLAETAARALAASQQAASDLKASQEVLTAKLTQIAQLGTALASAQSAANNAAATVSTTQKTIETQTASLAAAQAKIQPLTAALAKASSDLDIAAKTLAAKQSASTTAAEALAKAKLPMDQLTQQLASARGELEKLKK